MKINTERLVLRPFELGDLDTMHAYASDEANTEYMLYLPNRSVDDTERFLCMVIAEWEKDELRFYEFAITLDGKHIGAVSVWLEDGRSEGELGWIIHKDYQGKGFAYEAAKVIVDFAFRELGVKKLNAHCDYRNLASVRIMEKIGMVLERDDLMRRYRDSDEDVRELMYSRSYERGRTL